VLLRWSRPAVTQLSRLQEYSRQFLRQWQLFHDHRDHIDALPGSSAQGIDQHLSLIYSCLYSLDRTGVLGDASNWRPGGSVYDPQILFIRIFKITKDISRCQKVTSPSAFRAALSAKRRRSVQVCLGTTPAGNGEAQHLADQVCGVLGPSGIREYRSSQGDQAFGFGAGRAVATTSDSNPQRACAPSQKGLLLLAPQRQRPITDRPAR